MAVQIEYLVLLVMSPKNVDHYLIPSMGFQSRRCRIGIRSHTSREHITQFTTLIFTIEPWLQTIIDTRQARYVLQVRHERCTDDIVLILEVQRKVTVVSNVCVFRIRLINDNVRFPGVTQGNVFPGFRITVHRTTRPDDDTAI